jgi:hypothetical protein
LKCVDCKRRLGGGASGDGNYRRDRRRYFAICDLEIWRFHFRLTDSSIDSIDSGNCQSIPIGESPIK